MSDDYPTPVWLSKFFRDWFDPCPQSPRFDGLRVDWEDPTFANIPYSDPLPWAEKAIAEAAKGVRVVLLTRVDPSTEWWLKLSISALILYSGYLLYQSVGFP